jgi:hypothetical protein
VTGRGPGDGGTPTAPVSAEELRRLFPGGTVREHAVSLNFDLAVVAGRSRALAALLAVLPPLRTHLLAVVHKPR